MAIHLPKNATASSNMAMQLPYSTSLRKSVAVELQAIAASLRNMAIG
jgi:hypothetical protein